MFTKIRFRKDKKGFTLIELLIVVAIIAILAAIAIPQFGAYRRRGFNASANSDLRNIRTSEESMMADYQDYGASNTTNNAAGSVTGVINGTAGSAFWLVGAISTSKPNVQIAVSPGVWAQVVTNGTVESVLSTAYTACTGHGAGDQYYGAESDQTAVLRKAFATAATWVNFAGGAPECVVAPTTNAVQLTGNNWISVQ